MVGKTAHAHRSPTHWGLALVCLAAGVAVFQFFGSAAHGYSKTDSLFWWWIEQWIDPQAETQHGWLILALSGWLVWRNLRTADRGWRMADWSDRQSEIHHAPSAIGAPLGALVIALLLHALGYVAQQGRVSIVALLLFLWGVLRLGGGRRWGAAAAFPVAFLVFAIPFSGLDSIGFWLRMWVVKASAAIAHGAGIPVVRNGTQLLAPDGRYNYDVAAACSGIRSLMALAALSLLAGYLNFSTWRRRAFVLLLCFPLVYFGNLARIVAIVFAAEWGGPAWGERAHDIMGLGVFVVVLGGVLAGVAAIRRWWPEKIADCGSRIADLPVPQSAIRNPQSAAIVSAAVIVVLAIGEMVFLHHVSTLPPRGKAGVALAADGENPVELPAFLGTAWAGRRAEVSAVEREILPADTGFSRKLYVTLSPPPQSVLLSIVLSGRDRTSIHRPELCLVGQGWTILDRAAHRFAMPGGGDFPAAILRVRREVQTARGKQVVPQLVAYWFVNGERVVTTHWERLAVDAWNRLAHARTDRWAYVLLQADASDGEEAALARMQVVLDGTLPVFQPRTVAGLP